ncbi:ATP-grasp domain-containing protein [Syntrophorhabdus aromaticivorans]|jgi:biotin carboxylase|uniref:ATP-grasp domain-containing protein n=1 Tax=Syntrophorhabdus aromaticivorans TaxID=328301 RepID=UPI00041516B0|nr:ATP-grasp domain-containing protein [Syntrophorhabdus aromaticivorans]
MKDQPTVLVLGASHDQLYLIETAKRMGCYVLAVDIDPMAAAFVRADEKALISTRDIDGLLTFVRAYRRRRSINAVITMGSEIPMTIAILAEELGIHALSRETAYLASNKLAMKKRWAQKGIPVPWFDELRSGDHLRTIVKDRGWDLIVKPTDRSGARGITKLAEGMDCTAVFERAKNASFEGRVIVEDFLPGAQESTESIVYDDFFKTAGVSDRNYDMVHQLMGAPVENGGTMPSVLPADKLREIDLLLENAARALGITRGVGKGDVALDAEGKPRMVEMAARLSGGWMSAGLIPVTSGVNIVQTITEIALGWEPNLDQLNERWHKHAALRYFFPSQGILKAINGELAVRNQPWLHVLEFYKHADEVIDIPQSHAERFGCFLVEGNTRSEVLNRAQWVYNNIDIRVL